MNCIAVVGSDGLTRELIRAMLTSWSHEVLVAAPRLIRPLLDAARQGRVDAVVMDARRRADAVFRAAAQIEAASEDRVPLLLICDRVNRDRLKKLAEFGVHSVIESETCTSDIIKASLDLVLGETRVTGQRCLVNPTSELVAQLDEHAEPGSLSSMLTEESGDPVQEKAREETEGEGEGVGEASNDAESEIAPEDIEWYGLYNDQGLLRVETASSSSSDGKARELAQEHHRPLERELSRRETEALVAAYVDAKPLKENVQIALSMTRDSQASVDDLANVIRRDQGLSARVLQVANSAAYRRGKPVSSVEQASVRIGLDAIRQAISVGAVMEQMGDVDTHLVNPLMLWEHAFAVATISADLARQTRVCPAEDAFMIGLLHDLGRVVMFEVLGEKYSKALRMARERNLEPHRAEKTIFEINHADVADIVFRSWSFGETIVTPIANHHLSASNLHHLDPLNESVVSMLQLADKLAHAALIGDSGNDWIYGVPLALGEKELPAGVVKSGLQRAEKAAKDMRAALGAAGASVSQDSTASILRDRIEGAFQPAFVSTIEFDSHEFTVRSLAGDAYPCEAPGVLVVHLGAETDGDAIVRLVSKFDDECDSGPVPAVVIAEEGAPDVDSLWAGRTVERLPGSYRRTAMVRAINNVLQASPQVAEAMAASV